MRPLLAGLVALQLTVGTQAAVAAPPVVAVGPIEAPGLGLKPTARRSLALFVHARLAALPGLRVLPGEQVRAQLGRLRREAAACTRGQGCALELGRRLAASKVLAPRILPAGTGCLVTLTLLDVRTATAEAAAASKPGACGEGPLAASLSAAFADLARQLAGEDDGASQPAAAPRPAPEPTAAPRVSVYFSSKPPGAPVVIDGDKRGVTPIRLDLVAGERYRAELGGNFPFERITRTFVARSWQQIDVKLGLERIDPMERATAAEWFSFAFGSGMLRDGERPLFSFGLRLATLKWRYLFVSAAELLAGIGWEGEGDQRRQWSLLSIGSRAGLPIYLGQSGKHQLLAGLGLSYAVFDSPQRDGAKSFALVPGLEYVYVASNGTLQVGGGAQLILPVAGELDERPYQLLFTLRVGISISPVIRAHRRAGARQRQGR